MSVIGAVVGVDGGVVGVGPSVWIVENTIGGEGDVVVNAGNNEAAVGAVALPVPNCG